MSRVNRENSKTSQISDLAAALGAGYKGGLLNEREERTCSKRGFHAVRYLPDRGNWRPLFLVAKWGGRDIKRVLCGFYQGGDIVVGEKSHINRLISRPEKGTRRGVGKNGGDVFVSYMVVALLGERGWIEKSLWALSKKLGKGLGYQGGYCGKDRGVFSRWGACP